MISNNNGEAARAAMLLKQVRDPEIGLNVIDLGLIYQLDFDDDNHIIYIRMTLTSRFCPLSSSIKSSVKGALQAAYPRYQIHLNIVFDPMWNSSMITPEGKVFLDQCL